MRTKALAVILLLSSCASDPYKDHSLTYTKTPNQRAYPVYQLGAKIWLVTGEEAKIINCCDGTWFPIYTIERKDNRLEEITELLIAGYRL